MMRDNSKNNSLCQAGVALLLIYSFFIGLDISLFKNPISLTLLLGLALFLILCVTGIPTSNVNSPVVLSSICVAVILLNRNHRLANGVYKTEIQICIMFFVFFLLCTTSCWHKLLISFLVFFGLFYSVSTIVLFFIPQLYLEVVVPLFGGTDAMESMIKAVNSGLAAGFSAHYSTTAIYLATTATVPLSVFIKKNIIVKRKKLYILLSVLIIAAVLLTGKRALTIFVLISVLVCYYVMNRQKSVGKIFKILIACAILFILILIASQFIPALQNVLARFESTIDNGDITSGRSKLIDLCFDMFKSNPIIGSGWGKFTFANSLGFLNGHNVYVQLIGENGILLSIPFFMFFVVNLTRAIKTAKSISDVTDASVNTNLSIIYSVFIQVLFLLYCFTGNPLYDYQMLCPYILGCAISEYYYREFFSFQNNKQRKIYT